MSVASKHNYRFVFLRSEKWKTVRSEALLNEKAKCQICEAESVFNDAHHLFYPASVWDTSAEELIVLCRPCHNLVHALITKIGEKSASIYHIRTIVHSLYEWRLEKQEWSDQVGNGNHLVFALKNRKRREENKKEKGTCICCRKIKRQSNVINAYSLFLKLSNHTIHSRLKLIFCDDCLEAIKADFADKPIPGKIKETMKALKRWMVEFRNKNKPLDQTKAQVYSSDQDDFYF